MKLKLRVNCGREWPERWQEGQVVDVDEALGSKMLGCGIAVLVTAPAKEPTIHGVPPEPEAKAQPKPQQQQQKPKDYSK